MMWTIQTISCYGLVRKHELDLLVSTKMMYQASHNCISAPIEYPYRSF